MLGNIKQNLYRSWVDLGNQFELSFQQIEDMWKIFVSSYEQPHRHYHNLIHIDQMILWTNMMNPNISNIISFELAIWFHDLIYDPKKKDNELKSAQKAVFYMESWGLEENLIEIVEQLILSTAKHYPIIVNEDFKFFLDIDLAILGSDPKIYHTYSRAIRKEFNAYPNLLYKIGRKKVLKKFLQRPSIYFTDIMREQLEDQARNNILQELRNLK